MVRTERTKTGTRKQLSKGTGPAANRESVVAKRECRLASMALTPAACRRERRAGESGAGERGTHPLPVTPCPCRLHRGHAEARGRALRGAMILRTRLRRDASLRRTTLQQHLVRGLARGLVRRRSPTLNEACPSPTYRGTVHRGRAPGGVRLPS